jgi:DNA polymerase III subunit chi
MTQVDFYILPDSDLPARLHYVCRLAQQLRRAALSIYIATDDELHSRQLDQLLWEQPPESFLPHHVAGLDDKRNDETTGITISHHADAVAPSTVYINLRNHPPPLPTAIARVIEIVVQEASVLDSTRKNYAAYKSHGAEIKTHKM